MASQILASARCSGKANGVAAGRSTHGAVAYAKDSTGSREADHSARAEKKLAHIVVGSTMLCALILAHLTLLWGGGGRLALATISLTAVLGWAVVVTAYAFHALWSISQHRKRLLEEAARVDSLTGAFTADHLYGRLEQEYDSAVKTGEPAALAYVKLRGVDKVNDVYGHAAGNIVLKELAQVMLDGTPPGGIVARLGGQEFAALMPRTPSRSAQKALAGIKKAIARYSLDLGERGTISGLDVVVGLASYPCDGASPQEIIRAAAQKASKTQPAEKGHGKGMEDSWWSPKTVLSET